MNTFFLPKNKLLAILLLVVITGFSKKCVAQTDTTFWFAAPEVSENLPSPILDRPIVFSITAYQYPSSVTISQPASGGMPPQTVTIPANSTTAVDVTQWIDQIECKPGDVVLNYGLKISGTAPISAYYEVNSFNGGLNPEFYVLKGSNALGTEFYISSQYFLNNSNLYNPLPYSSFNIVATQDNTTVTITPTNNIVGHSGGVTFTVSLNKGQTYAAIASSELASLHLQGSHVTSDKPIAITLSDDLLSGAPYGGCADLAGDQTVPITSIGTDYVAVQGNLRYPYDKLYIMGTQGGTTVNQDGTYVTTLGAGQSTQLTISNPSTYVQASAPVYAYQLSGDGCEVGSAILPKINCTGSSSVSVSRNTADAFDVMLVIKNGGQSGFLINNVASSLITSAQFSPVPGTGGQYYAAKISLPVATYPLGSLVNISNTLQVFQMGVLQGGGSGGDGYGFFSDFNTFRAKATALPPIVCIGDTLKLQGNAVLSATYSWTGPNGFTSNLQNPFITNVAPINAGQYMLTINVPGCGVYSDTETISVNTNPVVSVSPMLDTLCSGGNVSLTASGGTIYTWSPSASLSSASGTTVVATPPATTTYIVTGTGANGCKDTAASMVTVIPTPVLNITPTNANVCAGSSIFLTASGATTYSWSPAAGLSSTTGPGVSAGPSATTIYTVTGVNGGICSTSVTKTVTVIPVPSAPGVTTPVNYCRNKPAVPLTAIGANLLWYTNPTGGTGTATAPTPSTAANGSTIWYVSQTVNGCESIRSSISVVVATAPLPVVTTPIDVCQYDTVGALSATGTHILWYTAATGGTGTSAAPVPPSSNPGTTNWYATQTIDGCESDRAPVTVLVKAKPTPPVTAPATFCRHNLPIALSATGSALHWYSSAVGGAAITYPPLITANGSLSGTWYVSQVVNGCESDRAVITFAVLPDAHLKIDLVDSANCSKRGVFILSPIGSPPPYTISIDAPGNHVFNAVNAPVRDSLFAGIYTVHFLNSYGCAEDTTLVMPGLKQLVMSLIKDVPPTCYGGNDGSITVMTNGITGTYTYSIAEAGLSDTTGVFGSLSAGTYNIHAQDTTRCSADLAVELSQPDEITINTVTEPNYCHCDGDGDGSITALASGGVKPFRYTWSTGQSGPSIRGLTSGKYLVVATDAHSCRDSVICQVIDSANKLFIPNAFTPNGDGRNDVFRVHYVGNIYTMTISIFNRFGQLVFSGANQSEVWDGTYKGVPVDMGTYFYNIVIRCGANKTGTVSYKGDVTVIR
ncbi:MAG: gliding motility-associated C-terminal domain-containing protein [Flavipsychrobacter sp.]|nr:gliding motility-associated C-terminal domain-containing protein [Flavipsychrobacter sp.]